MKKLWPLSTFCLLIIIFLLSSCGVQGDVELEKEEIEAIATEEAGPMGAIYYIQRPEGSPPQIIRIVLPNGEAEAVYTAPELSQLHEFDVLPDGNSLILAQTPPPTVENGIFDRTVLASLDLTTSNAEAKNILGGEAPNDFYNMPVVSSDGQYLYYSRLGPDRLGLTGTDTFYGIERYDLKTGETLPIVPNSIWPQISPDGSKVLFIILDLPTQQRGLGIVNHDGTAPELLIDIGRYFDIDSPVFAPDGQSIYLSIVETQPAQSLLERVLGVNVAYAHTEHNIPSTWWELELGEGESNEPTPLNTAEVILVNGRFHSSMNRNSMALSTSTGIELLDLETAPAFAVQKLVAGNDFGMLDWVDLDER